ncbi:MAG TPA: hypothetical protein PLC25_00685, partial [Bacilli bacterium]|nr:hypothetical protein [Bacilli bacterium]
MIVLVTGFSNAFRLEIPEKISGNYQVMGYDNTIIATISANNQKWEIASVNNNKLYKNGTVITSDFFINNASYNIEDIANNYKYKINIFNTKVPFTTYEIKSPSITINNSGADINYSSNNLNGLTTINFNNNNIYVTTESKCVYVNDRLIKRKNIQHGDIIFIDGLKLIPYSNRIIVCTLDNTITLSINPSKLTEIQFDNAKKSDVDLDKLEVERGLYDENDFFSKAPRFKTIYEEKDIKITPPPQKRSDNTKPAILTIGPRLTMIATTLVTLFSSITMAEASGSSTSYLLPSIIISVVTITSTFLWPALTRKYTKKENRIAEAERIKNYTKYLERKEKEIKDEHAKETQVLIENNVSLEDCQQIIYNKKRNLWERDITQKDFLNIRLGIGTIPPSSKIDYEETDFSTDDDYMIKLLKDMIERNSYLENVPECISLIKNKISAVIGVPVLTQKFMNSILLQLMTFHSFIDLKIV